MIISFLFFHYLKRKRKKIKERSRVRHSHDQLVEKTKRHQRGSVRMTKRKISSSFLPTRLFPTARKDGRTDITKSLHVIRLPKSLNIMKVGNLRDCFARSCGKLANVVHVLNRVFSFLIKINKHI